MCIYEQRPYRDRVVATCFKEPPASYSAKAILNFEPDLIDMRWGFLVSTIEDLLEIEAPLRCHWNAAAIDIPALRKTLGVVEDGNDSIPSDFVISQRIGATPKWCW